jgi:hypothetical protein
LLPRGRLSAADKQTNLKHEPVKEFRNSVYRRRPNEEGPTRLTFPASAFKRCIAESALDLPGGATKSKIARLTWIDSVSLDVYGAPQMLMSVVRNSDMKRTPDIRTRAILPQWAASFTVNFAQSVVRATAVANLFQAAGMICGIGDFRQQKGGGSFGQFMMVEPDDETFLAIREHGAMAAQDEVLNADHPPCYDRETETLLSWYETEITRRGQEASQMAPRPRRKKIVEEELEEMSAAEFIAQATAAEKPARKTRARKNGDGA